MRTNWPVTSERRSRALIKIVIAEFGNTASANDLRVFVAGRTIELAGHVDSGMSRACDILEADGMSLEKAAELAAGARRAGKDPVATARHIVKLRRALRDTRGR